MITPKRFIGWHCWRDSSFWKSSSIWPVLFIIHGKSIIEIDLWNPIPNCVSRYNSVTYWHRKSCVADLRVYAEDSEGTREWREIQKIYMFQHSQKLNMRRGNQIWNDIWVGNQRMRAAASTVSPATKRLRKGNISCTASVMTVQFQKPPLPSLQNVRSPERSSLFHHWCVCRTWQSGKT